MPRSIRHLLAAALAVAAISMTVLPAFAADQPILTGTVLDAAGQPFPVEDGTLTMTAPDGGGIYGTQVSVGGDGSFEVEVMPWGTEGTPAEVTDVPTNSVATVGDAGSRKSVLRSVTQKEWMSPPITTGFEGRRVARWDRMRVRAAA